MGNFETLKHVTRISITSKMLLNLSNLGPQEDPSIRVKNGNCFENFVFFLSFSLWKTLTRDVTEEHSGLCLTRQRSNFFPVLKDSELEHLCLIVLLTIPEFYLGGAGKGYLPMRFSRPALSIVSGYPPLPELRLTWCNSSARNIRYQSPTAAWWEQ